MSVKSLSKLFKSPSTEHFSLLFSIILLLSLSSCFKNQTKSTKTIAIANLGPHATLLAITTEFKNELTRLGEAKGQTFEFVENHVNFDQSAIRPALQRLKGKRPDLVLSITTSVSQAAQSIFQGTPLIFAAVTDPREAKLSVPGVSDLQNSSEVLRFVKQVMPHAKRIGIPYSPNEANDVATLRLFKADSERLDLEVVPVSIDYARDIPVRIRSLNRKVDCLYITNSNVIQPALPAVVSTANAMDVPVFNMSGEAVLNHQALGSFSVSYEQIGKRAADMAEKILEGTPTSELRPIFPEASEHQGYLSLKVLKRFKLPMPSGLKNVTIVQDSGGQGA